ncbi:MAG: hypothetical protein IJ995_00520 [Clostridia bacterium]|nr:hypothetical protein [Clostridia bacterium]MBR2012687.1 hypothetical protein [Clostridia bacterium]MBR4086377.1 hypothetical protein [Clostridia bacterium]
MLDSIKNMFSGMNFEPMRFVQMLDKMGIGMLVIFIIIGVIILSTLLINKIFSKK